MIFTENYYSEIKRLKKALKEYDSVLIGAGAGLSTAAGFAYGGNRFEKYFTDFKNKYGINDIYTGGFYPFDTPNEFWAWWSRQIWINRYMKPEYPVYEELYDIVKNKDYFVITTNVDYCFQKAGFDKKRLFYTQGDFGLFQCSVPCELITYDNKDEIIEMLKYQGYDVITDEELNSKSGDIKMTISDELIPHCPNCGAVMTTNLRIDNKFVEDEGWHKASERYSEYLENHKFARIIFWELGVGSNTPGIIKYPFWQMTYANKNALFAAINYGEAFAPEEISDRSVLIDGDIRRVLKQLRDKIII